MTEGKFEKEVKDAGKQDTRTAQAGSYVHSDFFVSSHIDHSYHLYLVEQPGLFILSGTCWQRTVIYEV